MICVERGIRGRQNNISGGNGGQTIGENKRMTENSWWMIEAGVILGNRRKYADGS